MRASESLTMAVDSDRDSTNSEQTALPGSCDSSEAYDATGLFGSDDFKMYAYKILPCAKRHVHDWTHCPFAHPGEKARRRDPRTHSYLAVPCPEVKQNQPCPRGDSCQYCHSVFEYWLHPSRYRTQLCQNGTACKRSVCFFAHQVSELRVPDHSHLTAKQQQLEKSTDKDSQKQQDKAGSARSGGGSGGARTTSPKGQQQRTAAQRAAPAAATAATAAAAAAAAALSAPLLQFDLAALAAAAQGLPPALLAAYQQQLLVAAASTPASAAQQTAELAAAQAAATQAAAAAAGSPSLMQAAALLVLQQQLATAHGHAAFCAIADMVSPPMSVTDTIQPMSPTASATSSNSLLSSSFARPEPCIPPGTSWLSAPQHPPQQQSHHQHSSLLGASSLLGSAPSGFAQQQQQQLHYPSSLLGAAPLDPWGSALSHPSAAALASYGFGAAAAGMSAFQSAPAAFSNAHLPAGGAGLQGRAASSAAGLFSLPGSGGGLMPGFGSDTFASALPSMGQHHL